MTYENQELPSGDIVIVRGSSGDLHVHRKTGFIALYDACTFDDNEGYSDIALIDPATLIDEGVTLYRECDILSVGYWTKSGHYEHPMRLDRSGPYVDWLQIEGLLPAPETQVAA